MKPVTEKAHIYILISILSGRIINMIYSAILSAAGINIQTPFYLYLGNFLYSAALCLAPASLYFNAEKSFGEFRKEHSGRIEAGKILYCIVFSLIVWCVGQLAGGLVNRVLGSMGIQVIRQISGDKSVVSVIMGFLTVCVAAPVMEELLYRGVLWDILNDKGAAAAIAVCAFVFAIAHGSITVFVMPLIYGTACGYIMYRYKNIIYPVVMHFICNALALTLTVFNISPAVMQGINMMVVAVGSLAAVWLLTVCVTRIKQIAGAVKKAFLIFISNILWIAIAADCILRNISFHK